MQNSPTTVTDRVEGMPLVQTYVSPQLINYGSINVLTAGGSGAMAEPTVGMGCANGATLTRC